MNLLSIRSDGNHSQRVILLRRPQVTGQTTATILIERWLVSAAQFDLVLHDMEKN